MGKYNVISTSDMKCQDIVLSSVVPAEESVDLDSTMFSILVSPRPGKTMKGGNLLLELDNSTIDNKTYKTSFCGIVYFPDDKFELYPSLAGLPYVAGSRADGFFVLDSVAAITDHGVELKFIVYPDGDTKANVIKFIKNITVKYAWVDEAS